MRCMRVVSISRESVFFVNMEVARELIFTLNKHHLVEVDTCDSN